MAFIANVGAGGAALNIGRSVPSSSVQTIEFLLPGTRENLKTYVELVWRDVQGHMGLRFTGMSTSFSEGLQEWLTAQSDFPASSKAGA